MNSAIHRFGPPAFVAAIALLASVLVSVMIQVRAANDLAVNKPSVELRPARTSITYPCPPCMHSISRACATDYDPRVHLTASANGFNQRVVYSYSVTGGQVVGEGNEVVWDLTHSGPGVYHATVEAQDKKHRASAPATVTISFCPDCVDGDCHCPAIAVNCYDQVKAGTAITCKAAFSGARSRTTFEWSARASNDEDLSPRIKNTGEYISIPTDDLAGRTVYVRVDVIGLDPTCSRSASASTVVKP
ncbi:MAG TPA: hypothetical protein VE961_07885 [Pyrinomonadaceae bacterium]|nr:hypothetical protein [Pyrinomonadaceae bacterium]